MKTVHKDRTLGFPKEATVIVQCKATRSVVTFGSEMLAELFMDSMAVAMPLAIISVEYEHTELPF